MSMHNIELTELERSGLEAHHLVIDKSSVVSDAFRLGIAWALKHQKYLEEECESLSAMVNTQDEMLVKLEQEVTMLAAHLKEAENVMMAAASAKTKAEANVIVSEFIDNVTPSQSLVNHDFNLVKSARQYAVDNWGIKHDGIIKGLDHFANEIKVEK